MENYKNLEIGTWVTIMVYDYVTNRNKYKSKKIVCKHVNYCGTVSYNGGIIKPEDIVMLGRPTKKQKEELVIKEDINWEKKQKQNELNLIRESKIDRLKKLCGEMFVKTRNKKYVHLMHKLYNLKF